MALFSLPIYICANTDDPAVAIFPPYSCLKKTVAPFTLKIIIFEFTNVFSLSFWSCVVRNYLLFLYLNIYAMKCHCIKVQFNLKSLNLELSRMQPLLLRMRSIDITIYVLQVFSKPVHISIFRKALSLYNESSLYSWQVLPYCLSPACWKC